MDGPRPPKRPRIAVGAHRGVESAYQRLLHQGGVSISGSQRILRELGQSEVDVRDLSTRQASVINHSTFDQLSHVEEVPTVDGGTWQWELVDPSRLLSRLVSESPPLAELYAAACSSSPPSQASPWRLIVGFDEFTPGNKLQADNRRKCMNVSFSFVELGPHAIQEDWTWVTPVCARSSRIESAVGGWSAMLASWLRLLLIGPHGLSTVGAPLDLGGGRQVMLYARLSNLLSDGDGHRQALDWKGASALKPCFKHPNVFKRGSGLAHRRPGYVEISCSDPDECRSWTGAEVCAAMDLLILSKERVAAGTMTKSRFDELSKAHGLNANPRGLLADRLLRPWVDPVATCTYDWVHSMLQDGAFTKEAFLFVQACEPYGVTFPSIEAFLKDGSWRFPYASRCKSIQLHRIFDAYRNPASSADRGKLKCSASELLGLYSLLRHYFETRVVPCDAISAKRESFEASCRVLDLILDAKRCDVASSAAAYELKGAIRDMIRCHIQAYGDQHILPKHHWMLDVPAQIERDGCVLDAFIIERIHLSVKSVANNVRNTSRFERSVLAGVLHVQFRRCQEVHMAYGLRGKVASWQGLLLAHHLALAGLDVSTGDIVFYQGDSAGIVRSCLLDDRTLAVAVEALASVAAASPHSCAWRPTGIVKIWPAASVRPARAWYARDGHVIALLH